MEKIHTISRDQLKSWIDEKRDFTLIDVLPEEYCEQCHLPGAKNACVFKVDFLDQVARIVPERGRPLVVYCSSARSHAALTAAEKLQSDDFFDVKKYPTARFEITGVSPISGAAPGTPNFTVRGKLTIKDVTREISFPAVIARRDDGSLATEAHFDIDRTKWNVIYGSGKFYENLGMHLVYDDVTIGLNLVAR